MPSPRLQLVDDRSLRDDGDAVYDVLEAVRALPWVDQLCPVMPHQYAVLRKSPEWAWFALEGMVRLSPDSYRAYFRGYQSANRYWDAPDGFRYWRTRFELNRCDPQSAEPLRRVDQGAKPMRAWDGPPWASNGSQIYLQAPDGRWWPTEQALAAGYQPCRACARRPANLTITRPGHASKREADT